jgi:hypothetical protein
MSRRAKVLALGGTTVVGVALVVVGAVLLQLEGYRADAGAEANTSLWFVPLAGVVMIAIGVVGVMLVSRKQVENSR